LTDFQDSPIMTGKNKPVFSKFFINKVLLITAGLFLISTTIVYGVQNAALTILSLDSSQFPTFTFYLQPFDSDGNYLDNITPDNVRVEEDENIIIPQSFQRIEPGVHWIAAINAGPRLKDLAGGAYRIDTIRIHLMNWMQNQPAESPNDFSLTTNTGVLESHEITPQDWIETFEGYQPDYSITQPNLVSLTQALELASSSSGDIPQKYDILYITPMMPAEFRDQLPIMAEHAKQLGVQVDVWLVGAGTLIGSNSEKPFKQLAEITGGSYFFFSGVEDLPDPSVSMEQLRWLYRVQYHSRMQTSGLHTLSLSVLHNDEWKDSNTLSYKFDVLPPNPIFFSPPAEIIRIPIKSENRGEEDTVEPESVEIRILVEFPDQYQRDLTFSRLFANDELVARNTEAPFDRFQWDLTQYTQSQTVNLKVEIQDAAGFSASTIEFPVQITIEKRNRTFFELIIDYQGWIIGIAVFLTLALLGSAFFTFRGKGSYLFANWPTRNKNNDPLFQQVHIKQLSPIKRGQLQTGEVETAYPAISQHKVNAVLVRLNEDLEELPEETIELPAERELLLGRQQERVNIHLDDSSVSPIHARICNETENEYTIYDEGSIAGTWVNFAPISVLGAVVQHGDTIQFGRLTYRFKIKYPDSAPEIIFLPYNEKT
jgi:hypothetical protein